MDHGKCFDEFKKARKIVVLTGAGVSTFSGIPDFFVLSCMAFPPAHRRRQARLFRAVYFIALKGHSQEPPRMALFWNFWAPLLPNPFVSP